MNNSGGLQETWHEWQMKDMQQSVQKQVKINTAAAAHEEDIQRHQKRQHQMSRK